MPVVILSCVLLVGLTIVIHYEALRALNLALPSLRIPGRTKMLAVIFALFVAHAIEIGVYGTALHALIKYMGIGGLSGSLPATLANCIYFSAETYTSLGFGDVTPVGPIRLLAGVEALNGLLLIGWSASYTYISMEKFWGEGREDRRP